MTLILPGISPARLKIEKAGKAYQERKSMSEAEAWRMAFANASRRWNEQQNATEEARRRYKAERVEQALTVVSRSRRMADFAALISAKHNITLEQLRGNSRCRELTRARHEFMYECHQAGHSFMAIGRYVNRDHTTCLYGARAHAARIESEKSTCGLAGNGRSNHVADGAGD